MSHVSINEVASYRTERTVLGCDVPPLLRRLVHPTSVLEITKTKWLGSCHWLMQGFTSSCKIRFINSDPAAVTDGFDFHCISSLKIRVSYGRAALECAGAGAGLPDGLAAALIDGEPGELGEARYFIRKTMYSNRKFDITDPNKSLILYLFSIGPFIY